MFNVGREWGSSTHKVRKRDGIKNPSDSVHLPWGGGVTHLHVFIAEWGLEREAFVRHGKGNSGIDRGQDGDCGGTLYRRS